MDAQAMQAVLPSWSPGATRDAVVAFLVSVTGGPGAVPPAERIATFDNDGTLACERPQTASALFLAAESASQGTSELVSGGHEVLRALGALFVDRSTTDYEHQAEQFLSSARHPRFDRPLEAMVYAPMRELLSLLAKLEFSVFLCSDSSRDFMRVFAGPAYGLRRPQIIGSEVQIELRGGELVRTAVAAPLDDGPGKVVHIWDRTGQRPLLAAGNAAGDIEMLGSARFALLIDHDDAEREYQYTDARAQEAAASGGWTVVSMRHDFAQMWVDPSPRPT